MKQKLKKSWKIYPIAVFIIFLLWLVYMWQTNSWPLFQEFWPISITMAFGSFIAGSTPGGGGAVAFPIFTKLLDIPTADARTFGLMIQSLGMLMAALFIVTRKIKILPKIILWVTAGGILGQVLGTFWIIIPSIPIRVLFTSVTVTFGIALAVSRWLFDCNPLEKMPQWKGGQKLLFFFLGVLGGIFAANTGAGIDMLTFILLTLAFGINEKISTHTTVIIMGFNALVGFFLRAVFIQDIGVSWNYWLVSVPIVILGAPLGAWAISKCPRDWLVKFLLVLIGLEFVSTLWLVPFDDTATIIAFSSAIVGAIAFYLMLKYRELKLKLPKVDKSKPW